MTEPPPLPERKRREDRPDREHPARKVREDLATYRIAVGKRHKVNPGAIVGAIANEGGLHRSDFGHINIKVDHSLVELPAKLPRETWKKLENTRIQGVLIDLKLDRGRPKADGGAKFSKPPGGKPRRPKS